MQHKIESVPVIRQRPNWCAYAALSMALQYWDYDISQEQIFEHVQGQVEGADRYNYQKVAIGIGNIAIAAQQLTTLKTTLWSTAQYERARQLKPDSNIDPHKILRSYIAKDIPCIVRIPHHYNVAVGFDTAKNTYTFNEPQFGVQLDKDATVFERQWSDHDPKLNYDSRHLILAIGPEK